MQNHTTPLISIIIPCFNSAEFLTETLDSVKKQTYNNWECVVVNDGSKDDSLKILREYEAKDSRYIVIDKGNEGPSVARNIAIAASSGKYILPLDADDLIDPSYAEKAINYLESHPKTKLVYCKAKYFGDRDDDWKVPEYQYKNIIYENCIFCSCVYRRKDFDKTNGYNQNMIYGCEDWDFLLSLLEPEDEVYCIPEVLFLYRKHGITRTTSAMEKKDICHLRMMLNHPELYSNDLEQSYHLVSYSTRYYENELNGLLNSNAYKLGFMLIKPFKWLRRLLDRDRNKG